MPKVLIVDDRIEIAELTAEKLELAGWIALAVPRGGRALELLDLSFDAVVVDQRMPEMDGESLLSRIYERPELNRLCVVMLTAFGDLDIALRCFRMGAYQYLQKPFQLEDLKRILISGIALQRVKALPRGLLIVPNLSAALDAIRSVIQETLNPAGLAVMFLKPDGSMERAEGQDTDGARAKPRRFVAHILESRRPVYACGPGPIDEWQPVMAEARSLLAAPIPTAAGGIAGVLDVESTAPDAFDRNWLPVVTHLADLFAVALELLAKQQLMVERQQWQELPLIVNELRHRISTPVQVITLQASELIAKELKYAKSGRLPQDIRRSMLNRVSMIERNGEAIRNVTTYLQDVSSNIPLDKRRFNLMIVVKHSKDEIKEELLKKHIKVISDSKSRNSLFLEADQNLVQYCLQCLLRNSIESIEERRKQSLNTDFDTRSNGDRIAIKVLATSSEVRLEVEDTGIGISPDHRDRIFQPLFSTKQVHKSRGLGLFGVRRIMNQHEGKVSFTSNGNKGATFTLSFPQG